LPRSAATGGVPPFGRDLVLVLSPLRRVFIVCLAVILATPIRAGLRLTTTFGIVWNIVSGSGGFQYRRGQAGQPRRAC
jgi:hypothetical protein